MALTIEQVRELKLPPSMEAKRKSPTYAAYVRKYGTTDCWELEALEPATLAEILTSAIEEVIDTSLFNQEIRAEQDDAAKLFAVRKQCASFFKSLRLD